MRRTVTVSVPATTRPERFEIVIDEANAAFWQRSKNSMR